MKPFLSLIFVGLLLSDVAVAAVNVVLLSVDTLRADRLGCYGYPLNTSPNLDAFAEGAMLFENAVCEIPLTCPSFTSMLTSQYPRSTGVTRNGLGLAEEPVTVPELFNKAGYETFCVQSNWTLKAKLSGLHLGFDTYDDDFHRKRWGLIKAERNGDEVTRLALDWLEKRDASRPFFAWIHYSDPHAPYKMHRGYNPQDKQPWSMNKKTRVWIRYDSEVAFVDAQIKHVLDALPQNTAVLFVADHGESLFEHGNLGHGRRLYQQATHIPLMIRAPSIAPGRSTAPVRGLDVGTTLLGLAGLQKSGAMIGLNLVDQVSPSDRVRIIETYGGAVPNLPGAESIMGNAPPMRQGVLSGKWKLILGADTPELFDFVNDPGELQNLASEQPATLRDLQAALAEWNASVTPAAQTKKSLSKDDVEALESLGYIE